jgi:hypothetical protein
VSPYYTRRPPPRAAADRIADIKRSIAKGSFPTFPEPTEKRPYNGRNGYVHEHVTAVTAVTAVYTDM